MSDKTPLLCSGSAQRIVLVGVSGFGKSATGNTILGRKEFESELSSSSLTLQCQKGIAEVCEREVTVVDTPGFFNTELSEGDQREEMKKALTLCEPGPHAFLLVMQLGRFSQQEKKAAEKLEKLFGERVWDYILVLFTHGDELRNINIDQFVKRDGNLNELLKKCGNRYHVFNNKETGSDTQVRQLLEKIETMVSEKNGKYYVIQETQHNRVENKIRPVAVVIAALIGAVAGVMIEAKIQSLTRHKQREEFRSLESSIIRAVVGTVAGSAVGAVAEMVFRMRRSLIGRGVTLAIVRACEEAASPGRVLWSGIGAAMGAGIGAGIGALTGAGLGEVLSNCIYLWLSYTKDS